MSYRIRPDATVRTNVRRLVSRELARALAALDEPGASACRRRSTTCASAAKRYAASSGSPAPAWGGVGARQRRGARRRP